MIVDASPRLPYIGLPAGQWDIVRHRETAFRVEALMLDVATSQATVIVVDLSAEFRKLIGGRKKHSDTSVPSSFHKLV